MNNEILFRQTKVISKYLILGLMLTASAQAAESCLEISEAQMKQWVSIQPEIPNFTDLLSAKRIIDAERSYALKFKNDKRAHCYLGCRISADVNFETARYAAWQKEYSDATDCNPKTHFEVADYDATIKGAQREVKSPERAGLRKSCTDYCKKNLLNRMNFISY